MNWKNWRRFAICGLIGIIAVAYYEPLSSLAKPSKERQSDTKTTKVDSTITTNQIERVTFTKDVARYISLFGNRIEDRKSVERFVTFLNQLLAEGKAYKQTESEKRDPNYARAHRAVVEFTNGTWLEIYSSGSNALVFGFDGTYTHRVTNKELASLFSSQFQPTRNIENVIGAAIGDPIVIQGNDGIEVMDDVDIFLLPPFKGNDPIKGENGIQFPSKEAIWIHRETMQFGRYKTDFHLPAYGRMWDGTQAAIKPGQWSIVVSHNTSYRQWPFTVKRAKQPLLTVNGLPITNGKPLLKEGKTLLPLRLVAELSGYRISWDELHNRVGLNTDLKKIVTDSYSSQLEIWVNGKLIRTKVPAQLHRGSVYVPLEVLNSQLGIDTKWLSAAAAVNVDLPVKVFQPEKDAKDKDVKEMLKLINTYAANLNAVKEGSSKQLFVNETKWARSLANRPQRIISLSAPKTVEKKGRSASLSIEWKYVTSSNRFLTNNSIVMFTKSDTGRWLIKDLTFEK